MTQEKPRLPKESYKGWDVKHRIIHVRELPMLYVGPDSQGLGLSQNLTWFVDYDIAPTNT
jgi:hypothetical protein